MTLMRVILREWLVGSGEVWAFDVGSTLEGEALRLTNEGCRVLSNGEPAEGIRPELMTAVTGVVEWIRWSPSTSILEMIIDSSGTRVLTEHRSGEPLVAVGDTVSALGVFYVMAEHEREEFGVPELRRSWAVLAESRVPHTGDYILELEPA